jgi:hypothetical protein
MIVPSVISKCVPASITPINRGTEQRNESKQKGRLVCATIGRWSRSGRCRATLPLVPHPMEATPHQAIGSIICSGNAPFTVFLCTCRNLGERDDTVHSVDTRHIVTADIADLTMVHDLNEYVRMARQSSPAPLNARRGVSWSERCLQTCLILK